MQRWLWTSLSNIPITTLVKCLSSFIERTAKTSPVSDIRGRIYNSIDGDIIEQVYSLPLKRAD